MRVEFPQMNLQREKEIGLRLRAFREMLQIPRSRFAVAIGYGSERLASYESGRAPVRWEVFVAITKRYHLTPYWLALGEGAPKLQAPYDVSDLSNTIPPRALFSEVYDKFLAKQIKSDAAEMEKEFEKRISWLDKFVEQLNDESLPLAFRKKMAKRMSKPLAAAMKTTELQLTWRRLAKVKMSELDLNTEFRNNSDDMKLTLSTLLNEIRKLTEPMGMKARLAADLGVPPTRVSEWLSGKHDPSGEVTLQLLNWVERQKRKK